MVALTLGRLLKIRPAEWPRLGWLYGMLLLSLTGTIWGETIVEAAFLRQVGVRYLPLVISAGAILQLLATGIYTAFTDRVADDRLLMIIVGFSAAAVAAGIGLLTRNLIFLAYPLLYLVDTVVLRFLLSVHWATYVNGFYDTRSAKRIVPVLGSAARVAGILGGFTMPLLTSHLAPAGIVSLWLMSLLGMIALIWGMPRALGHGGSSRVKAGVESQDPLSSIRTGYRFVSKSSYLRWLALTIFLMMVLLAYLNYQGGKVLLLELGTVQRIADFTGLLNGLANLVILPFQLFLMSRLIGRLGLGNAEMIFPGTTSLSTLGLLVAPGLATAGLAYIDRTTLRTSIFSAVDSLLYNAVPLRLRGRARAFISGTVVPVGTLCGGLLLSLWTGLALSAPGASVMTRVLPAVICAVVAGYLISAWFVRREYAHALVTMLEHDDLSLLAQQTAPDIALADPTAGRYLQHRLAQPGLSPDMAVFLAQLALQAGGQGALATVESAARAATDGDLHARMVGVLAAADLQDDAAWTCLAPFLDDADGRVRRTALAGLATLPGRRDEFAALAERLLADDDPAVRLQALAALAVRPDFAARPAAVAGLEALLGAPAPGARAQGVALLGQIVTAGDDAAALDRLPTPGTSLLAALGEPDDQVRLAAALALEEIAGARPAWTARIAPALSRCVRDPVERIRAAAVSVLARDRSPDSLAPLFAAIGDPSLHIRTAAVDALALRGPGILPDAERTLACGEPGAAAAAAVILGRLAPRQYRPLVLSTYVAGVLRAIYRSHGEAVALAPLRSQKGTDLVCALIEEQNRGRLAECFFLLSAVSSAATLQMIERSLSSPERSRRAGAAEALEALTSPQIARLLATWCDPERTDERLQAIARAAWDMSWPAPAGAFAALLGSPGDPWLRAAARYAWPEITATAGKGPACQPAPDAPAAEEEKMLATIERITFLKEVPFFESMTVDQLKILAEACEEAFYPADAPIFNEGDPGGMLYVVVSGRVALQQEKRKGSFARLSTIEAGSYFGEMNLFDNSPRTTCALAVQDTILLSLDRDPLIALARRNPDLSLALVKVLSVRLREAQDHIAELTRTRPRALDRLYDGLS